MCGHPGTGKTSSVNSGLAKMRSENKHVFRPLLFTAMAFPDVKNFGIVLYERIHEEFFLFSPRQKLSSHDLDDEDIADKIERLLLKISKQ